MALPAFSLVSCIRRYPYDQRLVIIDVSTFLYSSHDVVLLTGEKAVLPTTRFVLSTNSEQWC